METYFYELYLQDESGNLIPVPIEIVNFVNSYYILFQNHINNQIKADQIKDTLKDLQYLIQ